MQIDIFKSVPRHSVPCPLTIRVFYEKNIKQILSERAKISDKFLNKGSGMRSFRKTIPVAGSWERGALRKGPLFQGQGRGWTGPTTKDKSSGPAEPLRSKYTRLSTGSVPAGRGWGDAQEKRYTAGKAACTQGNPNEEPHLSRCPKGQRGGPNREGRVAKLEARLKTVERQREHISSLYRSSGLQSQ